MAVFGGRPIEFYIFSRLIYFGDPELLEISPIVTACTIWLPSDGTFSSLGFRIMTLHMLISSLTSDGSASLIQT